MKRKRFGAYEWKSILSRRYKQLTVKDAQFQGVIGLMYIDETTDYTSWRINGEEIQVCQKGMKWLQLMPDSRDYVITAMISREGKINLFYIDMIDGGGKDPKDGIAYYNDLYLDLIVHPNQLFYVDDRDELEDAYQQGAITRKQYEQALHTCATLQNRIKLQFQSFMEFCYRCLERMEAVEAFCDVPCHLGQ